MKFNENICYEIVEYYSCGLPLYYVASLVNVSRMTIWRWRKRGEVEGEGDYYTFFKDMLFARAMFIKYHLDWLNNCNDPVAHMYLLGVGDYDEFSEPYTNFRSESRDLKSGDNYEYFN